MNIDQFQKKLEGNVTLVDFNATWCAPCKAQEPVIKYLMEKYHDRAFIMEIDIDKHRDLATKYMVQSIPTLIIFKDGKEKKRFIGLQSEAAISKSLDEAL